jgi:hypothetical protein
LDIDGCGAGKKNKWLPDGQAISGKLNLGVAEDGENDTLDDVDPPRGRFDRAHQLHRMRTELDRIDRKSRLLQTTDVS